MTTIPASPGFPKAPGPYRGTFGEPRPPALDRLSLPPAPMPSHHRGRPLKAWRYVGVYGPEVMLCLAAVRIGRARQSFWAVWDRAAGVLEQRTRTGAAGLRLRPGGATLRAPALSLDLTLEEVAGVESVCPTTRGYAWTRKQGGIRARGTVVWADGRMIAIDAAAVVDDTAAYYDRHTRWRWSAGVGRTPGGTPVAWNLVDGVNDPPRGSERTVWVDGVAREVGPVRFADDLTRVDALRFDPEATRAHRQNLLLVRSRYRQPFGTFSGTLPGGPELAAGFGVMECHDVFW